MQGAVGRRFIGEPIRGAARHPAVLRFIWIGRRVRGVEDLRAVVTSRNTSVRSNRLASGGHNRWPRTITAATMIVRRQTRIESI